MLVLALGLQWLALQSVAWTAMLIANARHGPLAQAVAQTFDGAHPCDLCHAVAAGDKATKKSSLSLGRAKIDIICASMAWAGEPPWSPYFYVQPACALSSHSESPPVPPPRLRLS